MFSPSFEFYKAQYLICVYPNVGLSDFIDHFTDFEYSQPVQLHNDDLLTTNGYITVIWQWFIITYIVLLRGLTAA